MGDETSTNINTEATPKTTREKNLEAEVKRETDPVKKRAMREELDDLKREREREDARNRSAVAEAEEHRKQNVRQRRLEGGSRFNIRYQDQVPSSALTPGRRDVCPGSVRGLRRPSAARRPGPGDTAPLKPAGSSPMRPRRGLACPTRACCSRRLMLYSGLR